MTWVKVCGITDEAALVAAVEGGADAVGFVLANGSPRHLEIGVARALMTDAPILRFLVTVDLRPADALALIEETGADGIQNHGRYASDVAAEAVDAGYLSLRPVSMRATGVRDEVRTIPDQSMPLFDTPSTVMHGGTGETFDWDRLDDPGRPFVLAGGLGPANVAEAIAAVRPFGVDASSGLEVEPGVKDPGRVFDFIAKAKQT